MKETREMRQTKWYCDAPGCAASEETADGALPQGGWCTVQIVGMNAAGLGPGRSGELCPKHTHDALELLSNAHEPRRRGRS